MPLSWVHVRGEPERDVYLRGNPTQPVGRTNTTFQVQAGRNDFQIVDFPVGGPPVVQVAKTVIVTLHSKRRPQIIDMFPGGIAAAGGLGSDAD